MLTTQEANKFARQWIAGWNAHDLDQIMAHYADNVVFTSPFVKRLGVDPAGCLQGREALRSYFRSALEKFPLLKFHLHSVLVGMDAVTLVYESVNELLAAETMAVDDAGQVTRVWAQYDRAE